jgi:F420-non-reducing hydrogenase iron-sulfur subunit
MCTGRIDPGFLLHALSSGFDGVLIGGCHTGDCHYRNGNCKAAFRIRLLQRLMQQAGLEAFRVRRIWAGAAEGKRWAQEAEAFTAQLREAGPQRASGSRTATLQSTPG